MLPATASSSTPVLGGRARQSSEFLVPRRASRISTLEIAVRADVCTKGLAWLYLDLTIILQAKKLLSHPIVSQHLSEIWAGNVLFHSVDQIHKNPSQPIRRTATLYDPRDASLFKLSRLRVPRYRHLCSTLSLAILLLLSVEHASMLIYTNLVIVIF
jgi:hypothetical protein